LLLNAKVKNDFWLSAPHPQVAGRQFVLRVTRYQIPSTFSILFRKPEHRAIDVNILTCAFPSALHPLGQPSVARPAGFLSEP
jgi:hypothetical protein